MFDVCSLLVVLCSNVVVDFFANIYFVLRFVLLEIQWILIGLRFVLYEIQ